MCPHHGCNYKYRIPDQLEYHIAHSHTNKSKMYEDVATQTNMTGKCDKETNTIEILPSPSKVSWFSNGPEMWKSLKTHKWRGARDDATYLFSLSLSPFPLIIGLAIPSFTRIIKIIQFDPIYLFILYFLKVYDRTKRIQCSLSDCHNE